MNLCAIIPARGGSVGLPGKNIRPLCGKPLIGYSIDVAREFVSDEDIYVSTDDSRIIEVVERDCGLKVPFIRPAELATSTASTNDVILHVLDFAEAQGKGYDTVLLLQPTSPLRGKEDVSGAIAAYSESCDMVVGVFKSHAAVVMCTEDQSGYVAPYFNEQWGRRQDIPEFFEINGAIYVINVKALRRKGLAGFDRRVKYVMPQERSIDIDNLADFEYAEYLMKRRQSYVP